MWSLGLRNGVRYEDIFESYAPEFRNQFYYQELLPDLTRLPDYDFTIQQVFPGEPMDGPSGPEQCTDPILCGIDRIVVPGQACDEESCPGLVGVSANCPVGDLFCGVTTLVDLAALSTDGMATLDTDGNGTSDVTYLRDGYPEVIFLQKRLYREKFGSSCSATVIADGWAITALHCFHKNRKVLILDQFDIEDHPSATGWSMLTAKDTNTTSFQVVSDHFSEVAIVTEIFIPYSSTEATSKTVGYLPERDLALFRLEGGIRFRETHLLPILEFEHPSIGEALTFVGFGWSDVSDRFDALWVTFTTAQRWAELKLAAFNFVDQVGSLPMKTHPQIIWDHGDPPGAGGPCNFDSGGPIYRGFNRGFWNSPRILVGVVSGLSTTLPTGTFETNVNACTSDSTYLFGESLAPYRAGICQITGNKPRGCQSI